MCWCCDDCSGDYEQKHLSLREKRREYAIRCVREGRIQGYLAYCGGKAVGWCNANRKQDCLLCYGWRRNMGHVPVGESGGPVQVKSVFCFAVAPEMKRKGIATQLLERVCQDALREGFHFVEAYPSKEFSDRNHSGPLEMYRKSGFTVHDEAEQGMVLRKSLDPAVWGKSDGPETGRSPCTEQA